ncbi:hypothetical protein QUA90_22705 [Microcoleus sp. D3_18_C4]
MLATSKAKPEFREAQSWLVYEEQDSETVSYLFLGIIRQFPKCDRPRGMVAQVTEVQ